MIVQAQFEDLKEILSLQKQAFLSEAESHGNYNIEPLRQTFESITSDFKIYTFLKAVHNDKIVGSIKFKINGDTVWVGKLMVSPDYRNRGLGRRLLLEVEAQNSSASRFQLFTAASSTNNIRLYESVGYRQTRLFEDENQAGMTFVEMEKKNTTC